MSAGSSRSASPPSARQTQWYFQRYVAHLPAGGEIVLFDRSWYNRAGVERVMGFCTDDEYREFLRLVPEFERMLIRSGIVAGQVLVLGERRRSRSGASRPASTDPDKRWKLSPMDLESRARWVDYSRAKDEMFRYTDTKQSPWWVVDADDKRRARLNCIAHLLVAGPLRGPHRRPLDLPPRQDDDYVRPPLSGDLRPRPLLTSSPGAS